VSRTNGSVGSTRLRQEGTIEQGVKAQTGQAKYEGTIVKLTPKAMDVPLHDRGAHKAYEQKNKTHPAPGTQHLGNRIRKEQSDHRHQDKAVQKRQDPRPAASEAVENRPREKDQDASDEVSHGRKGCEKAELNASIDAKTAGTDSRWWAF